MRNWVGFESEACRLNTVFGVTEQGACNVIGGAFGLMLGALIEFGGVSTDEEICEQDQMRKTKWQYKMKVDARRYFPIPNQCYGTPKCG